MAIRSDDRVVVQTPAWGRLLLRTIGPMVAGDILIPGNVLPRRPAELVKTMRRLRRAAQHRTHG